MFASSKRNKNIQEKWLNNSSDIFSLEIIAKETAETAFPNKKTEITEKEFIIWINNCLEKYLEDKKYGLFKNMF